MNIKNKQKNTTGITLIALVITIIVLLILAGISIATIKNSNLINKVIISKEKSKEAEALEDLKLKISETQIEKNGKATLQDFVNKLDEDKENEYVISTEIASISGNIPNIDNMAKIYLKYKGYWFEVDNNLNIEVVKKENSSENYIIYNANGGKNAPPSQSKKNNVISESVPTRENYVFKGWGNSADSKEILYKPGDKYTGTESITLYAIWESNIKGGVLQEYLQKTNIKLDVKDIFSYSFLDKIMEAENKKDILLKTNGVIEELINDEDKINLFNMKLVPELSSNTNVLFSSEYSSKYAGYKAFDNNYGSYWCTQLDLIKDSYIGYNMQKQANVYFASVYNDSTKGTYNSKTVILQCSNDNISWKDASDQITLKDQNNTIFYIKNTKELENSYQYWRILIKDSYSTDYAGISEVQFYGTIKEEGNNKEDKFEERDDKDLLNMCNDDLKNLLLKTNIKLTVEDVFSKDFFNKVAESNENKKIFFRTEKISNKIVGNKNIESILDKSNIKLVPKLSSNTNVIFSSEFPGGYEGYRAFDKNYESYWCTQGGLIKDSYIGYNMQKQVNVYFASMCNEKSSRYNSKVVVLQCSNDNINWKDASDEITLENQYNTYCIKNTKELENSYQYWRILIKEAYSTDYVGISEVQFY